MSYLTDNEILKVASHSGSPVPIIPLISKIFPAVHNLRLIEVSVAANDPTYTDQGMLYKHQVSVNLRRILWHRYSDALNMQYVSLFMYATCNSIISLTSIIATLITTWAQK